MSLYIQIDYSKYAKEIVSFPEYLEENSVTISIDDLSNLRSEYFIRAEIKNIFSRYLQKIHTDLKWNSEIIEEEKKDQYFHLIHIANVRLEINCNQTDHLSTEKLFTIFLTNRCLFEVDGLYDAELSNEKGKIISNYGYLIFLEFKKYLLDQTKKRTRLKEKTNFSNPLKIAFLYEFGLENTTDRFPIKEDRFRLVHSIIGGDYDNIKKTMKAGITNNNRRAVQEYINSKTF